VCAVLFLVIHFNRLDDPGGGGADAVEVGEDQFGGGAVEGDIVRGISVTRISQRIDTPFSLPNDFLG